MTKYQEYFNKVMKKYDVESPSQLDADKKKKFFEEIDSGWESESEKSASALTINEELAGELLKVAEILIAGK